MPTSETVRRCLLVATTMAKGTSARDVTLDMVDGWRIAAERHWLTDAQFRSAFEAVLDRRTFFPAWAEVLAEHRRLVAETAHLILDPVKTGGHMGVDEIGSRSRRELLGLPYVELRKEEPTALPSPEVRETALARIESLEKRAVKRMPRERSAFDETPDPEAVERQRAMVEAVTEAPR